MKNPLGLFIYMKGFIHSKKDDAFIISKKADNFSTA